MALWKRRKAAQTRGVTVTGEVMSNDYLDYAREHSEARLPMRGRERATNMTYEQTSRIPTAVVSRRTSETDYVLES
jgi:hypothetical protein